MTTHHFPVIRPHQKGFLVTCTCGWETYTLRTLTAHKRGANHAREQDQK